MRATTTHGLVRHTTFFVILFALLPSSLPPSASAAPQRARPARGAARAVGWETVPSILARIRPPRFPARDFSITDYGARAGGGTDNTDAIRRAIGAAHVRFDAEGAEAQRARRRECSLRALCGPLRPLR